MDSIPQGAIQALSPWEPGIFGFVVYFILVTGLMAVILFLSGWLGVKKKNAEKTRPYESGILPTGSARLRYPVPFFLVATFFLIFDVEAAYIFSWAIAFKELGWAGWLQITFFIVVLAVSLFYVWFKGGLEWGSTTRRK
ncbi:MAG: NADH-quinone oxidoreductase subunit A [Syntrophobacteraceae bacterium]|jgi:NADH-quinone oxidoreductase subunit A|nr:NADH-quinone oxidoreductase subunit A [Syntrophobacteraceae bacterium]